jgi:hypothetical protein
MGAWLIANGPTILVALALAAIVTAIIVKLIKDRKKGRSSCGCGCANCAMRGSCHKSE